MARSTIKKPARFASRTDQPGLLLAIYGIAIFLSAGLLFAVQPLFTKMVLPILGGSPSVWSVAMVFFQATLLAGYLYAHLLTRQLPGGRSVIIHMLVMAAATLALPLSMASGWGRPPASGEAVWMMGLFAASIGLPFFALSANAPLLQAWFARTGHPSARDPYFLYAASNVGSFLALLSYPLLAEPFTRLGQQTAVWSALFVVLIVLIGGCGLLLLRSKNTAPHASRTGGRAEAAPDWRDAAVWVALAAVPSAFLIAVTAHISTDIASAPLLWVIPLALYLLTFVIVFQRQRLISHEFFLMLQPAAIALLVAVYVVDELRSIFIAIAVNLVAFFVSVMVCHGELARRRPAARYLTSFYLWMSVGGVVGGISAALIAPLVFDTVAEYPILIVAVLMCRPGFALPRDDRSWHATILFALLILLAVVSMRWFGFWPHGQAFTGIIVLLLVAAALFLARDTFKLAGAVAGILILIYAYQVDGSTVTTERSFFGVNKVYETPARDVRVLMHGTTIHGAQRVRDIAGTPLTGRPELITYFSTYSPMARVFQATIADRKGRPARFAVVGLGAGMTACYLRPEDILHFYEIDETVIRIATNPEHFTFISECKPDARMILGDARLTLADAPDGYYDLIVMDAFTSDAVPVHLLTREAMALYLRKLAPGGMVAAHVMNRHMELETVFAGVAEANGMVTRVMYAEPRRGDDPYIFHSAVAAAVRNESEFDTLLSLGAWEPRKPDRGQWVWTDDYSNIIGAMIRHLR